MTNHFLKLLTPLLIWALPFFAWGQKSKLAIDSLQQVLQKHPAADTTKVNILNALARAQLRIRKADEAAQYVAKAQELAQQLKFTKGKAYSLNILGRLHAQRSEFSKSVEYFKKSRQAFDQIGDQRNVGLAWYSIGLTHYFQSDYKTAQKYFEKSRALATKINDQQTLSTALNGLASAYADLSKYEKAIQTYVEALEVYRKLDDTKGIAGCYNNMGTAYDDQGNYPQAAECYHKALATYRELKYKPGISKCLNNLGIIYKKQREYDKALQYYEQSLSLGKQLKDKRNVAKCLNNMGLIYKKKGDNQKAVEYLEKSLKLSKQIGNQHLSSQCLTNIADIMLTIDKPALAYQYYERGLAIKQKIGDQKGISLSYLGLSDVHVYKKEYPQALDKALTAKKIADDHQIKTQQKEVHNALAEIYSALGQYQNAYENHVAYKKLYDEIFNKKKIQKITQLESQYKYQKELALASQRELKLAKKVETANLNLAQSQKQTLQAIIGFLVFLICAGVVIVWLIWKAAKSERTRAQVEQKLLRSQMTPHFIFNSLSILQGIILNKEYKKAITYLSKFSRLLRIVLENSRDKIVPLDNELKAVENYLIVQNLGASQPYDYSIDLEAHINPQDILIPPMMIQPFVENAIEHGFTDKKEDKRIQVNIAFANQKLTCAVVDNGVGIGEEMLQKNETKKSLATAITTERLKIFSKEFKVKTAIDIQNRANFNEKGTIVTLVLPYKIKKDD
ncbi:tetratricopeptide repeat protein [uncultured Microscilla sp.]|uniref:tetratricopeptide repeat protein n=1 Tax=uncultured Microscilla sp. TaxID=432653 RepID=UPI00261E154F|nr:tetratricopeptide repeat protein [uncultured Microscilla sp.]